ncbi:LLM class F420-dependent oxidoreductase [Paractinoplanes toevensis]|uniref:LLM class F420-dependent oxidoreductase n=1 Tax=Paractinoplanes toevensis TaxID=571911 RepID=UPI001BB34971|nr:LLM class F420-dependent oxidoreductase [Actinoplanes toevensis]
MRIGVVFPQNSLGDDPGEVRAYAQAVEELGYRHIRIADHVLGADRDAHPGWTRPYDVDTDFHEPFVLFGYLAAITSIELVTSVIILPQRQTALVAKQAAEIDILTGGKFRLGIGVGWNAVEFEALGLPFDDRGKRYDEQIELLRRYWTERSITHRGEFETVTGAGIAPRPVQRPIPLWFGAQSAPAYRRTGRLADGWFPMVQPGPELAAAQRVIDRAAVEAGRDPATIGIEGGLSWTGSPDAIAEGVRAWREAGATHLAINTSGAGVSGVDAHIKALTEVAEAIR